jgi:hypothetical protein
LYMRLDELTAGLDSAENLASTGFRTPNLPTLRESLHRLASNHQPVKQFITSVEYLKEMEMLQIHHEVADQDWWGPTET